MRRFLLFACCCALSVFAAIPVRAACMADPTKPYPSLARIDIATCESARDYAQDLMAEPPLPWLFRWYVGNVHQDG